MMRAFWDRLTGINARQVFLVAFLLLAGTAVWSLLRSVETPGSAAPIPSLSDAERTWTPPPEAAASATPVEPAGVETQASAFASTTIDAYLAHKETERLAAEKAAAEAAAKAAAEAAAKAAADAAAAAAVKTPPAAPPPPTKVSLCYRGIFKRMDGTSLALIETSDGGSTSFYREGEKIAGVTVGAFDRQQIILTPPAGAAVTLGVNASYTVSGE